MNMEEIFKNVGYSNFELSNLGRVKFLNYRRTGKEKITLGNKNGKYRQITAYKDGKRKVIEVHRLVAEAFIPIPEHLKPLIGKRYPSGKPMLQVNHKDEDTERNFVWVNEDGTVNQEKTNLEWATAKENINFGTRTERAAKTKSIPILQYDKSGVLIKEWASAKEAERQAGFSQSNICQCCKGKIKSYKGYKWAYQ